MRRVVLLLFFSVICTSCFSERKLLESYAKDEANSTAGQTILINGTYPDTCCGSRTRLSETLLEGLFFNTKLTDSIKISDVVLTYDNKDELNVKLMQGSLLYREFNLEATKKNGYLSIKRNLSVVPIPFFYIHHERKLLVFKNSNDELVTILGAQKFAIILIMSGGYDYINVNKFKAISKTTIMPPQP